MNLIFLIIVFAFAVIPKIIAATRQPPTPPPRPTGPRPQPRLGADTEEERMRRFMEAVGLPKGSAPPQPLNRPRLPAKNRPLLPVTPASAGLPVPSGRLRRVPAEVAPPPVPAPQPTALAATVAPPPPPATETGVQPITMPEPSVAPKQTTFQAPNLLRDLRNPAAIREAIILREILGPPKALQA